MAYMWSILGNVPRVLKNVNSAVGGGLHIALLPHCSVAQSCPTLCDPMDCSTPGLPVHHQLRSLLKLKSIESMMSSNHLILRCPLLFPSIRISSNKSPLCIRRPKYWSFSSSISPSNEYSGLISFRIDWFDLPAVQGILKSLLQHHSSIASVLWHSAFFMVQLLHLYMTTRKTIALTTWTFVSKVMSLLFNILPPSDRLLWGKTAVLFEETRAALRKDLRGVGLQPTALWANRSFGNTYSSPSPQAFRWLKAWPARTPSLQSHKRPGARTIPTSPSWNLNPQTLGKAVSICCSSSWGFGVICDAALDNQYSYP